MRILGIDPGSRFTGFGLVRCGSRSSLEALEFGRLRADPRSSLPARLASLVTDLEELLDLARPDLVAVESTFLGMNPRSLMVLSQARGAILGSVGRRGVRVVEFAPAEVKSAVTGNGRAAKDQVESMVRRLLGLAGRELAEDAADALAVAVCAAQRRRFDAAVESSAR